MQQDNKAKTSTPFKDLSQSITENLSLQFFEAPSMVLLM